MPTLFFMPWAQVADTFRIGPITFLPYERGLLPGALGKTSQKSIDEILGNYADRAFKQDKDSTVPVEKAIILRWPDDDERGGSLSPEEIEERIQQTQFVVFAAISAREFGRHSDYCNADDLMVTGQNFSEEHAASTAITTRRRDGSGTNYMGGTRGKPVFFRPMHVATRYKLDMEREFALKLLNLPDGPLRERILQAVTMYNRANTDANEVPPSAEIVFMRAAIETLVDADHTSKDLKKKLTALMAPHLGPVEWHDVNIPPSTWQTRWADKADRPFEAWVEDFCHWRNEGAHGKGGVKKHDPAVWTLWNHLLFTSWFTSRIVKCLLAREGLYTLTEEDKDVLLNTEQFFTYDILASNGENGLYWHTVLNHVQHLKLARDLEESFKSWPVANEDDKD